MIIMDVDYFKKINGRYGHIVGDQVLQKVAFVLDSMAEQTLIAGRIRAAYRQAVGEGEGELLLHNCYPMEPAGGSRDVQWKKKA